MNAFRPAELIITKDSKVYHLGLGKDDIGTTIFTVGDPDRVSMVSKYFDRIDLKTQTREFKTHTGWLEGEKVSVISTGIGTDNIDIVINELDALVNIDLTTAKPKDLFNPLQIIRIGTTGSISSHIQIDDFLINRYAIGIDGLIHYYANTPTLDELELEDEMINFFEETGMYFPVKPYVTSADRSLFELFSETMESGIGITAPGFYAPQGRFLRAKGVLSPNFYLDFKGLSYHQFKVTNLEMETAGIYGLSRILGHRAISCNVILANRLNGRFSLNPEKSIENLIQLVLSEWIKKRDDLKIIP
jgi:uridine phosphorylase